MTPPLLTLNPYYIAKECRAAWLESERLYQGARYDKAGAQFRTDWLLTYIAGGEPWPQ